MKKYFFIALVVVLSMGLAATAMAELLGSVHDLRAEVGGGETELCVVCHTPHNAMSTDILWNHTDTANTSFQLYSSAMLDGTIGDPSGISKLCLSCHDGSTAIDAYGGKASPTVNISAFPAGSPGDYTIGAGGDLRTTHPISITYPDGVGEDDAIKVRTSTFGTTGTVADYLEGDLVQCSSCHDVHASVSEVGTNPSLLRDTLAASALCIVCHDK